MKTKFTLANRVSRISSSPTLALSAQVKKMRAEGIDIVGFGAGEPDFDTPFHIKAAAEKALLEGFTKYTPASGIDELKDIICERYNAKTDLHFARSEVIICCGAKHVLFNIAVAFFDEGDEVLIPSPYWVTYPEQVKLVGAIPVFIPLCPQEKFSLSGCNLESHITEHTKAIIINTPNNPTGTMYSLESLSELILLAIKHNTLIIYDECYERITYGKNHVNILSLHPQAREYVICVNAVSKTYAMTGWRIGYAVGNEALISAMTKIQSQSTSNPNSIAQKAAVEAITGEDHSVSEMVNAFDERRKYIVKRLNNIKGIRCDEPDGAFYVFPCISDLFGAKYDTQTINSSTDFADFLIKEAKVAVVPGIAFGNDNYMRFSYAQSIERIKEGMDRIEAAVSTLT